MKNAKNINKNEINNKTFDFNFLGNYENHPICSKEDVSIEEIKTKKENFELSKKLIRNNLTSFYPFTYKISKLIKFNYQEQKLILNLIKMHILFSFIWLFFHIFFLLSYSSLSFFVFFAMHQLKQFPSPFAIIILRFCLNKILSKETKTS